MILYNFNIVSQTSLIALLLYFSISFCFFLILLIWMLELLKQRLHKTLNLFFNFLYRPFHSIHFVLPFISLSFFIIVRWVMRGREPRALNKNHEDIEMVDVVLFSCVLVLDLTLTYICAVPFLMLRFLIYLGDCISRWFRIKPSFIYFHLRCIPKN